MNIIKQIVVLVMIGSLLMSSMALSADKVSINAGAILDNQNDLRGKITQALQDEQVLQQLSEYGIEKKEVESRLLAMSDRELVQVQQGVERNAGGEVFLAVSLTTIIVVVILILLLR